MQNYTENAKGTSFNSRECVIFQIPFEIKVCTCYFEKKNFCIIPAGIACSKSTIELVEQGMKYVQSEEERPQNNITEVTLEL